MLKNVLVVPKFGRSIMSIVLMQQGGCRYVVDNKGARLEKGDDSITLDALDHNNMFYLVGDIVYPEDTAHPIIYDDEDSNDAGSESDEENDDETKRNEKEK